MTKSIICQICHIALLEQHPEEKFRETHLKCPICGYTEKVNGNKTKKT